MTIQIPIQNHNNNQISLYINVAGHQAFLDYLVEALTRKNSVLFRSIKPRLAMFLGLVVSVLASEAGERSSNLTRAQLFALTWSCPWLVDVILRRR